MDYHYGLNNRIQKIMNMVLKQLSEIIKVIYILLLILLVKKKMLII
nr:MAG TPA: hypothetical protein [Crassvirales sp.]